MTYFRDGQNYDLKSVRVRNASSYLLVKLHIMGRLLFLTPPPPPPSCYDVLQRDQAFFRGFSNSHPCLFFSFFFFASKFSCHHSGVYYFWLFHVNLWQSKLSIIAVLCRYWLFKNTLRTYYEIQSLTWLSKCEGKTQGSKLRTIWTRPSCPPSRLLHERTNKVWAEPPSPSLPWAPHPGAKPSKCGANQSKPVRQRSL